MPILSRWTGLRRKPWRYRWVDADRDEILARLLAINKQRAEEEAIAGVRVTKNGRARRIDRDSSDAEQRRFFYPNPYYFGFTVADFLFCLSRNSSNFLVSTNT